VLEEFVIVATSMSAAAWLNECPFDGWYRECLI
jgi:hypothetical protein